MSDAPVASESRACKKIPQTFSVSVQNALGYHCDKGMLSSIVSWIVAGNVTPSFVEGTASSSQVSAMVVLSDGKSSTLVKGSFSFLADFSLGHFFLLSQSFLVMKSQFSLRECCGFIALKGAWIFCAGRVCLICIQEFI